MNIQMSELMMSFPHNFLHISFTEMTKISYFSYETGKLTFYPPKINEKLGLFWHILIQGYAFTCICKKKEFFKISYTLYYIWLQYPLIKCIHVRLVGNGIVNVTMCVQFTWIWPYLQVQKMQKNNNISHHQPDECARSNWREMRATFFARRLRELYLFLLTKHATETALHQFTVALKTML